jgi:hypothetical protein
MPDNSELIRELQEAFAKMDKNGRPDSLAIATKLARDFDRMDVSDIQKIVREEAAKAGITLADV